MSKERDRRETPVQIKVKATQEAARKRGESVYERPLKIKGSVDDVLRAAMNETPINRTALIIEWQQQALSHHRLAQDMEINATQRRIHREAARIYTECADELLALLKNEDRDKEEVEG